MRKSNTASPAVERGHRRAEPDRQLSGSINSDIHYFGNLPYDVLSPIGSNGAYYYGRVRYTF